MEVDFECEHCNKIFVSQKSLGEHKRSKFCSNNKNRKVAKGELSPVKHTPFLCDICKHKGKIFSCSFCDYEATTKINQITHEDAVHHGKTYKCSKCEKKCRSRAKFNWHIKYKHEQNTLASPFDCNTSFETKFELIEHSIKMHERNPEEYYCFHCSFKCKLESSLKAHKESVHLM